MFPAPARLLIESLFMPLDTVPAHEVRSIVDTDRLDHMGGFAVTSLTTMKYMLAGYRHFLLASPLFPFAG
jgi:hypothetical protein